MAAVSESGCNRPPLALTETYIAVRELWVEGTSPTSNAPAPYTLTVSWGPLQSGWEVEPNDWPSAATPITGGNARGYLGSAEDRDWYSLVVRNKGKLTGSVEVPAGVDLLILFERRASGAVDRHGAGDKETFSLEVQAGQRVLIGIARKPTRGKDPKELGVAGPIRPVRAPD